MANFLNIPDCGGTTGTANTGIPVCDAIAGIPSGLIAVDAGVEFTPTDMATKAAFVAKLKDYTRAPRGSRAYPIWRISNFEDQTQEATKIAIGNLSNVEIKGVDAIPAFAFQHRVGEIFHKRLMSLESQNLKWFIVDSNYLVFGTETSNGNFTGYSATEFEAGLRNFGTPDQASNYPFSLQLADITEYKENSAFFQSDSNIKNISGMNDVNLILENQAANVAHITLMATGGYNLGIAKNTGITAAEFTATDAQTDSPFAITSVSWDAPGEYYIVTLDTADWSNNLTQGQKVKIDLVDAAALSAAGIDRFESTGPVEVEKA